MMILEIDMLVLDEGAVLAFLRLPCRFLVIFSKELNKYTLQTELLEELIIRNCSGRRKEILQKLGGIWATPNKASGFILRGGQLCNTGLKRYFGT